MIKVNSASLRQLAERARRAKRSCTLSDPVLAALGRRQHEILSLQRDGRWEHCLVRAYTGDGRVAVELLDIRRDIYLGYLDG